MFWIELIIVLAIIFIGVRVGGTFLAMAGGIGMFIMTFILHVTPSDPPITVILIMIAVICAAATMQACGGLDYLVRIAEKILSKEPENDYGTGSGCSIYLYIYVWYRSYRLQSSSGYQRNCH